MSSATPASPLSRPRVIRIDYPDYLFMIVSVFVSAGLISFSPVVFGVVPTLKGTHTPILGFARSIFLYLSHQVPHFDATSSLLGPSAHFTSGSTDSGPRTSWSEKMRASLEALKFQLCNIQRGVG